MTDLQILFRMVDTLTPEERQQLYEYLGKQAQPLSQKQRTLGLHAHLEGFWMSDDFDAELPDEFWGFDQETA